MRPTVSVTPRDPLDERHDEPVLLRQRHELRGQQKTELGVAPAHERLGGHRSPGPAVHDGLIMDFELAALERAP
jgi:hypothetical protein